MDVSKYIDYAKRIGLDPDKLKEKLNASNIGWLKPRAEGELPPEGAEDSALKDILDTSSSLIKVLAGTPGVLGEFYFPSEIIGGSCPRIVGEEEDIVWNAAAEACDSERVHVVWQSTESKVWYIAVRSGDLASHPDSWCPFASLLPGMKDAAPPPVCYTYFSDEVATMMACTADTLQIFRGTTLVVRAKAERTAREIGNAQVIELVPDRIMKLSPAPWYSMSLFEDRARRILAGLSIAASLGFAVLAFSVWLIASLALIASKHDLSETLTRSQTKSMDMMKTAERLRTSPMRDQLASFADLNDGLLAVNGLLQIYEIKEGKTRWRAIVPPNVTADRINELGGKTIETTPDGMAIGNAAEIDYETTMAGKK